MLRQQATTIAAGLQKAGHQALFAGGCVRDRILGIEPSDYDIATSARPEEVEALFKDTVGVGRKFGVILVGLDGHHFEVATFRKDSAYQDGRRPIAITYTSAEEDAQRRDFTINAMFEDPLSGETIDYVDGRRDLEAGILRAVGDATTRFREDRLRMLRAVRFAARLGFSIEASTMDAIKAEAGRIWEISAERIGDELVRILTDGKARRGIELLDQSGLMTPLLPELVAMKNCDQTPDFHPEGDVFEHTLRCLDQLKPGCTTTLALGVMLHDVAKPPTRVVRDDGRTSFHGHCKIGADMAEDICKRLRLSNDVIGGVKFLVVQHLRHTSAADMKASTLKRFLRQDGIEELLELTRIDALSSNGDLSHYNFCLDALQNMPAEVARPTPLINGHDLIEMGFEPGPRFHEVLEQIEDAQLEERINSHEQALELARRLYSDGRRD